MSKKFYPTVYYILAGGLIINLPSAVNNLLLAIDDLHKQIIYIQDFDQKKLQLSQIPQKYIASCMCSPSINISGLNLKYIPNKYKTIKLCRDAIHNNIYAIQYVPTEMHYATLFMMSMPHDMLASKFIFDRHKILYTNIMEQIRMEQIRTEQIRTNSENNMNNDKFFKSCGNTKHIIQNILEKSTS